MSSITHAGVPSLQPYRPPPLNLVQALPPPQPAPPPLSSSTGMTFDINNPTTFSVHPSQVPPLTYQTPLQTHRTPSLGELQHPQHHHQQQPHLHHQQPLSQHPQKTPTFRPADEPLKKRQRLHYDQPQHDIYPRDGAVLHQTNSAVTVTTPRFSETQHDDQMALQPSSTHAQGSAPLSAVYPNSLQPTVSSNSNATSNTEQGYYRGDYPDQAGMDVQPGIATWGRSPVTSKRNVSLGGTDARGLSQQQQQTPRLPPPNSFVYPGQGSGNASAISGAYPSHIPHLNQPVTLPSPVFGSIAQIQVQQQQYPDQYVGVQGGQAGYGERYNQDHQLSNSEPSVHNGPGGGAGYYSAGYAAQHFSPIVPPRPPPPHTASAHLSVPGARPIYSPAYGSAGSTGSSSQPGSWTDTTGQYAMVNPSGHAYADTAPGSYRGMMPSPETRFTYLPPGPPGRGLPGTMESIEERRRSKFSSESSSLASPVYHSGSSSYRPYPTQRPDMETESGWSAEPSSSTTKMSSSLGAEGGPAGSGSASSKGKRKISGSASGSGGKSQPVFVTKLFNMLEDPAIARSGLLKWSQDGAGFICTDPTEFARLVLPQFFKHNNWHSFVRQLNMYGFSKVSMQVNDVFLTLTTPSSLPMAWEFRHATFRRDDPEGIASIKRRSVKQTNQLRLQMEAEAAARQAGAGYAQNAGPTAYGAGNDPLMGQRPNTTSPALSTMSGTSPRYGAVRYSHPAEMTGLNGYAMHSAPAYVSAPGGRSAPGGLPAPYPSVYPRYTPYALSSAGTYDAYRLPPSATSSQYYAQPLSSASAVSQYPSLQPAGEPPVYQSVPSYDPDCSTVHALARQAGSISSQAHLLAHEQEALKQNTEEIRQETGVILDSLSGSTDANQALPDSRASRLREGIERLQDKVSEREKRLSASLASSESIAARAHALQGSLAAAASTTALPSDGRGMRPVNYGPNSNGWPSGYETLPPLQQPHYDSDDQQTRNPSLDQCNIDMHVKEEPYTRTQRSGSADTDDRSDRSHSRTRSGSGSGGIKELLN